MLNEFLNYIEENHLVGKGDKVLMAVSGGIDSMIMADLFTRSGIKTGIAHCNFYLRGRESMKDEKLVKKLAAFHKIPFYSIMFDTKGYAEEKGISIQMAARELRYRWFEEIRKKNGYDTIAVAHNLNDNIETLIINLTRGTGIAGLSGMKNSGNHIIRPLLFASREKIKKYCIKHKVNFREDKSNAETKYTRNKIRHLVIPILKEINPSIEDTLNETAKRLGATNDIVNYFTDKLRESLMKKKDGNLVVNIHRLKPSLGNNTLLYELFKPFGITGSIVSDLHKIAEGKTGGQIFTGTHRFLKNRNEIIISVQAETKDEYYTADSIAGLRKIPGIASVRFLSPSSGFVIPSDHKTACLDFEKITYPVVVRKWLPGDFFYPLGMKKKKKLSDYFIDRKFSRIDKEKALIMESGGKIVWIVGERIDDRFRVTEATKKILIIKSVTIRSR
jgi:tRNA(Ile)-lysidine synthetase, N-terminal domain/tRNA(Ile)-lysidine synthetase, C-terminal domain